VQFIEEISLLKQDNSELKASFMELEKNSNEQIKTSNEMIQMNANEINQLKHEIENMKEIQVLHKDSQRLNNEARKQNIKLPNETVKLKEETSQDDLKVKANIIKKLTDRIKQEPELNKRVNILDDKNDNVLCVKLKENIPIDQLSKCYDNFDFSYVIEQLGLTNYNSSMLMKDLFLHMPYHVLYYYSLLGSAADCYICLPMDSDVVTELRMSLRSRELNIKFSKSGFLVESAGEYIIRFYLYKEGNRIELFLGVKVNLQQIEQSEKMNYTFGKSYACLCVWVVS